LCNFDQIMQFLTKMEKLSSPKIKAKELKEAIARSLNDLVGLQRQKIIAHYSMWPTNL
jgi:hypothetical protein